MAASQENLLPLTSKQRNTFTNQREHSLKKSVSRPAMLQADVSALQSHQHLRAMHLLQRWNELKDRELKAQQHNRQLLQQFEKAQDTLREMFTLTTTMKTIRMEYERYLEESSPRWQQQLKAAQRKKTEENLKSRLKNTEDQVTKFSADQLLLPQGSSTKAQMNAAPQKHYNQNSHLDYNRDGFTHLHLPYTQPSWQTHPQSQIDRLPIGVQGQPQFSSHVPPSFLPPPIFSHPFQPHHLASMPGQPHSWSMHNPPGGTSPQPDYPWSWTASAAGIHSGREGLWGHLYTEEPSPERGEARVVGEEAEASRASSSKRERDGGSRSSHLSHELDIRPVRLSSGAAESSESSRESSQASRERRKKRGRSRRTSSDRERRSSQEESCRTSSAIITAAVTVAQSSESDVLSEKSSTSSSRRMRRSAELTIGSSKAGPARTRSDGDNSGSHEEESESTAEESRSQKAGDQSPAHKSESCREESGSQREEEEEVSGSVCMKTESGGEDVSSSAEENSVEEMEHNTDLREGDDDGDGKEDSQRDEETTKSTTEEEETGSEKEVEEQVGDQEEKPNRLTDGDKDGRMGSASSPDEEASEGESEDRVDKMEAGESDEEEEGGEDEEEEQEGDPAGEPEEERDSEDSIITPQTKSKKLHIIPEEEREDESEEEEEERSKTGPSDDDSDEFSDEDIERQLAPQEQNKEEKEPRADEKPKALCDKVEIFQVELDRSANNNHSSDSEEFDHFYD